MAIVTKLRKTIRLKDIDGTYDVELVEEARKRVYPEDEVREILGEALKRASEREATHTLLDPWYEVAREALEMIGEQFELSISPKQKMGHH